METQWIGRARRTVPLLIIGIGLVSLLAPVGDLSAGPPAVVLLELIPFIALAVAARRLTWWVALGCALGFGGLMVETAREVSQSAASTAAIAYAVIPFVLLATLPIVLAANELVRMIVFWRRGGTIGSPSRRDLALGLVLPLVGLVLLSWFGLVAGLGLAFARWSARSARTSI
jgi:hypothetical protein